MVEVSIDGGARRQTTLTAVVPARIAELAATPASLRSAWAMKMKEIEIKNLLTSPWALAHCDGFPFAPPVSPVIISLGFSAAKWCAPLNRSRLASLLTSLSVPRRCSLAPALPQADVVDSKPEIEKACHSSCVKYYAEYEKCKERIAKKGEGSCEPWAFDYWKCIDKCVSRMSVRDIQLVFRASLASSGLQAAPKIFANLK